MKPIKKYLYPLILALLSIASLFIAIPLLFLHPLAFYFSINMSFFSALVAFVYGLVLLIKGVICKDWVLKKFASNITAVFLAFLVLFTFFYTAYRKTYDIASRQVCGTKLSGLGKAIATYAYEHDGYLPDCNQWCDLLILYADAIPRVFICPDSDAIIGESSYAMNINLNGKKLGQVDPNTVVLFDTNYGKGPNRRDVTVSSRYSYKALKEKGEDVSFFGKRPEKRKVYKNRWSQAGGPEILTAENHRGEGANILFADGSVRWIPKEDFNNLNWEP